MSWIWKHSCANFDVNGRHICIKLEDPLLRPMGRKREKNTAKTSFNLGPSRIKIEDYKPGIPEVTIIHLRGKRSKNENFYSFQFNCET